MLNDLLEATEPYLSSPPEVYEFSGCFIHALGKHMDVRIESREVKIIAGGIPVIPVCFPDVETTIGESSEQCPELGHMEVHGQDEPTARHREDKSTLHEY